jgi:hypothetical protein
MEKIKTGNFASPCNIALDICQGSKSHKLCGKGFNCVPCMSNLEDKSEVTHIPKDFLFTMPEFFGKWNVLSLCLAGHNSDPCMYNHKDLIQFLRLCNRWNINVGYVSNGAYYSKHLIEEVARTCKWSGWSINAGTSEDHHIFTRSEKGMFEKIINNMTYMAEYCKEYNINHGIGYKFLITPYNYTHIYKAIETAKKAGANLIQIRPCELPEKETEKIDVQEVEKQIKEGLKLENPGKFNVYGIREKFTPDFKKRTPYKCIATPLGSTWLASGGIAPCPDRRWSIHEPNMSLGNFLKEGLEGIRRKWGGAEHVKMINECNKRINECIRCTSFSWHELYYHTIEHDSMDKTLI